ncbi:MAG: hypothetical protein F9K40_19630 [Kofleriaceae bacterium]|nr:MAG: hypothetical protein F9K40_19630 [Kofleriaceae bacterium]MBZ0238105.1 hypothetical protein [Kofleriaceae bacterium]
MNNPQTRAEMTKELKTARRYLIGVGILMFVMDLVIIQLVQRDQLEAWFRNVVLCIDLFVLGLFLALAYFVPRAPRFCLIAGLVLFWLLQLGAAYGDPSALYKGIIVKILFTMALWKGLQSASKAQLLKRDLERVFE